MRQVLAVVVIVMMWLISGCVSEETKQLAQGIHLYQARQAEAVVKLADFARESGALEDSDHTRITEGQRALTESTRSLSEILGEPEIPVEVDSW